MYATRSASRICQRVSWQHLHEPCVVLLWTAVHHGLGPYFAPLISTSEARVSVHAGRTGSGARTAPVNSTSVILINARIGSTGSGALSRSRPRSHVPSDVAPEEPCSAGFLRPNPKAPPGPAATCPRGPASTLRRPPAPARRRTRDTGACREREAGPPIPFPPFTIQASVMASSPILWRSFGCSSLPSHSLFYHPSSNYGWQSNTLAIVRLNFVNLPPPPPPEPQAHRPKRKSFVFCSPLRTPPEAPPFRSRAPPLREAGAARCCWGGRRAPAPGGRARPGPRRGPRGP